MLEKFLIIQIILKFGLNFMGIVNIISAPFL